MRLLPRFFVVCVGFGATLWLIPTSHASATTGGGSCAHGTNAGSTLCVNNSYGDLYTGGLGYWRNAGLWAYASSVGSPYHVNNEMWVYTRANESQFVEMGLRAGYLPAGQFGGCNCNAYALFWADFDTSGTEYRHVVSYPLHDNSQHAYQIQLHNAYDHTWDVFYDYNYKGTSTNQIESVSYEVQAGVEDSLLTPATYSELFDNVALHYRTGNNITWVPWPYSRSWIDHGCSIYPHGYCLEGRAPQVNEWLAQKN